MALSCQRPHRSIKPGAIDGVDLPTFTVLTGQNGTGKSHLLEALQNGSVIFSDLGRIPPEQARLFLLGQLLAATEGPVQGSAYKEPWSNLWNSIQQWRQNIANDANLAINPDQAANWVNQQAVNSKVLTQSALDRMAAETGKSLLEMTADDFKDHAPLIAGVKDPFAASISEVFLSYHQRRSQNEHAQWRLQTKGRGTALTDEQFYARFGAPPWDLLDETLALVNMPYSFEPPPEDAETVNYEVQLKDQSGVVVKPGDLSSGEKVLLAIAMSLFTGSRMSEAIELPRVLLLDEADASLHPSMVHSLLKVIQAIFVQQYNVRVILTTHSPSTVALAPPESLFVMSRESPRLRSATPDEALRSLTVGLSSLSVRLENRAQVFVESEYDQSVYQDLFRILKGDLGSDRSLEFIAAGKREVGGGCEAVKRFVRELRDGGNTTVYGVIDRDDRQAAPDHVFYLHDRRSIENLVFDPLILATFLLREGFMSAQDLGLPTGTRHFELKAAMAPSMISALSGRLGFTGALKTCGYHGGHSVNLPAEFLETGGHELEAKVVAAFPQLNRYKSGLKQEVVSKAMADVPAFVPASAATLLAQLLAA